jgi:hypothetical protein
LPLYPVTAEKSQKKAMGAGSLCVYERTIRRGCFGSYQPGDWLTIAIQNRRVVYMKNDTVFYTSTVVPSYPLFMDSSLYSPGATVNNAVIAY